MRRHDREVTDEAGLRDIIEGCKVCRIGLYDSMGLYIVPLNFGYIYEAGKLVMYFHCAREGRKLDAIRENPQVGFEMDCQHRLIEGGKACEYGYSFKSVIGNGQAELVEDVEEKKLALALLMRHQTGKDFMFDERQADSVAVIKITAEAFTGKYHK